MRRALGIGSVLGVLALTMGGCADDGGGGGGRTDREAVEAVEREALSAVDGVVHVAAQGAEMDFVSGSHSFVWCGESYAPRGVIHNVRLHFEPAALSDAEAADVAAGAMEDDGWTVERPPDPAIVLGSKGRNTLRFHFGPAAVAVEVSSECVETSDDVARDYHDRKNADVEWK